MLAGSNTSICTLTNNALDTEIFHRLTNDGGLAKFLLTHPSISKTLLTTGTSGIVSSLTTTAYSSSAPFAWGENNAVKIVLKAQSTNFKTMIGNKYQ